MARRPSAKVVLNRKALHAIEAGIVDALEATGEQFVQVIRPPDAEPFGAGLVLTPGYAVFVNGVKVAGPGRKPRGLNVKRGITLVMGEDFPGRLQETGAVHHGAQPHVTPAARTSIAALPQTVRDKSAPQLRSAR